MYFATCFMTQNSEFSKHKQKILKIYPYYTHTHTHRYTFFIIESRRAKEWRMKLKINVFYQTSMFSIVILSRTDSKNYLFLIFRMNMENGNCLFPFSTIQDGHNTQVVGTKKDVFIYVSNTLLQFCGNKQRRKWS